MRSYPLNKNVDDANGMRLKKLPDIAREFLALDSPGVDEQRRPVSEYQMKKFLKDVPARKSLHLKVISTS